MWPTEQFEFETPALAFKFISCIRRLVTQELDKIHVSYMRTFCRPISRDGVLAQSHYLLRETVS